MPRRWRRFPGENWKAEMAYYLDRTAKIMAAGGGKPRFSNDTDMLEAIVAVVSLLGISEYAAAEGGKDKIRLKRQYERFASWLEQALAHPPEDSYLGVFFRQHGFDILEKKIALLLAAASLGMRPDLSIACLADLQKALGAQGQECLAIIQAFDPEARLIKSGAATIAEEERGPAFSEVCATAEFLRPLVRRSKPNLGYWEVATLDELFSKGRSLFGKLQERCSLYETGNDWDADNDTISSDLRRLNRKIDRLADIFFRTLEQHKDWPIYHLFQEITASPDRLILFLVIGRQWWHDEGEPGPFDLFRGISPFQGLSLARAVSQAEPEVKDNLRRLFAQAPLRQANLIQIVAEQSNNELNTEDEETISHSEFELTDTARERLNLKRRKGQIKARLPQVQFEQLVLHDDIKQAIEIALTQISRQETFLKKWGIGRVITYGHGLVMLFAGPPGVGKTATAEAIAHRLGKPIIVADYAQIQSCWVGEIEKNIRRIFRLAREEDAVLFWDEADAIFYDRENAVRTWETREVNVLLQEIERFSGVCILATNRPVFLDSALERRLALRLTFRPPTPSMVRQIWERLIPPELPLAEDVNLDEISQTACLTGGEIKNALLNASRRALLRGEDSKVTRDDFLWAIEMEMNNRLNRDAGPRIGYRRR
ncbi:MAG: ATP-binding protein [Planctomycetota bacterium]|nr:ATP-binding protein [Planctomycetota bacterium]